MGNRITAGLVLYRVGFVSHRGQTGTVCTRTRDRYGYCGYGYSVRISNLQVTRAEP
jgi:hypothetical protein